MRLRSRHRETVSAETAHELLEALARRLGVVDRVVDELGVDGPAKVGEVSLALDAQMLCDALQAVRGAGQRRRERLDVKKVAALKLNPLSPAALAPRRFLLRRLGKFEERRAAVAVLDPEPGLVVERRELEGEAADHRAVRVLQRLAGIDFLRRTWGARDPRRRVTYREPRQIKGQVESDDEPSRLEGGRQKALVDKIMKAQAVRRSRALAPPPSASRARPVSPCRRTDPSRAPCPCEGAGRSQSEAAGFRPASSRHRK